MGRQTAVSTNGEQATHGEEKEAAAGGMGEGTTTPAVAGRGKAEPAAPGRAVAGGRAAEAKAAAEAAAAAADVRTNEAATPTGAAAERGAVEARRARLRRDRQQKGGAAAVD